MKEEAVLMKFHRPFTGRYTRYVCSNSSKLFYMPPSVPPSYVDTNTRVILLPRGFNGSEVNYWVWVMV